MGVGLIFRSVAAVCEAFRVAVGVMTVWRDVQALGARRRAAVVAWLAPLVQQWGTEVLVTDDLQAYRTAAEQLRLKVQVCWFHVRRWMAQALREVAPQLEDEWRWAVEAVEEIMREAPRDGGAQLLEVWQALPDRARRRGKQDPLERLRQLVLRVSNGWPYYQYSRD